MNNKPFIELPCNNGFKITKQEDIVSVSSEDKMICFTLENGEKICVRGTMTEAVEVLNYSYLVRCHQRHIINLRRIKQILKQHKGVVMITNESIPVSQSYRKRVFEAHGKLCTKWREGR